MSPPVSSTEDSPRRRREIAVREQLEKISRAQGILQSNNIQSSQTLVEGAADGVQQLERELDERRAVRSVFKKGEHALQVLTSSLSEFIKVYPGISDICKGADDRYGALVIGSLSVLLQV